MNKRDTREWQYVEPLIKGEYELKIKAPRDPYEHELVHFRVQSIKVNKKGKLEVTIKAPSGFGEDDDEF